MCAQILHPLHGVSAGESSHDKLYRASDCGSHVITNRDWFLMTTPFT